MKVQLLPNPIIIKNQNKKGIIIMKMKEMQDKIAENKNLLENAEQIRRYIEGLSSAANGKELLQQINKLEDTIGMNMTLHLFACSIESILRSEVSIMQNLLEKKIEKTEININIDID